MMTGGVPTTRRSRLPWPGLLASCRRFLEEGIVWTGWGWSLSPYSDDDDRVLCEWRDLRRSPPFHGSEGLGPPLPVRRRQGSGR